MKQILGLETKSLGLLVLRVGIGSLMLLQHGLGKLMSFSEKWHHFPDPLGIGNEISMILAVFAEFFCSIALILGIKTRLAAIPLFITMMVAILMIHAHDPWSKKELALLYAIPFLTFMFTGGGRYSLTDKGI